MIVQFAMWGDSLALRIPSAYAKEVHAVAGCHAELTVRGGKLVVKPIKVPAYTLDELLAGMTEENLHSEIGSSSAVGKEFC